MKMHMRHDEENQRFVAEVEGKECVVEYARRGDRTLEYHHTFVPEPLRHRGIASELVRYALAWAAEQGYAVVASCPFVKSYVERNPEAAGAVVATVP
jgi:predicted GNAT family acetyltransferase